MQTLIVANATNGLMYPHNDVSMFLSTHGHHLSTGYFADYAVSWRTVIHLLNGGNIKVVDATRHKDKYLTDGLKYGLPTWMLVFNRALGATDVKVCSWQTPHMTIAVDKHKRLIKRIRRLIEVYGTCKPLQIGNQVEVKVYNSFKLDDKPSELGKAIRDGNQGWAHV